MKLISQRIRGMQDVLPEEGKKLLSVLKIIMSEAKLYGFDFIRTPVLEQTKLFERSAGDDSDVVNKEMYSFKDKGGREVSLRPEGTAGAMRAVLENGLHNQTLPLKLMYFSSCYRYEKPQQGRYREFYQLGLELFGSAEGSADAQLISAGYSIIKKLGIEGIKLSINSIGCPECRSKYVEALKEYFKLNLDKLCKVCCERLERNPLRLLDCKEVQCKEVKAGAPKITDFLCDSCEQHFEDLKSNLDAMKISYKIDPEIVRGLDYYTGTVFEFLANFDGVETAICGGGRYDNLSETLGGPHLPAVGLGFGVERLLNVMEGRKLSAELEPKIYVASADKQTSLYAQAVCGDLREAGIIADSDISSRSLKAQLKYASKVGFNYVLILGNDEIQSGEGKIKNMTTGFEMKINLKNSISKQFLDILDNYTKNV